jgi:hypothetical protein
MEALQKTKNRMPYNPAIFFLGIYMKEYKSCYHKGTCSPMLIASLFTIVKLWKQPRCPTTMNGFRKCGIYMQWNFFSCEEE